VGLLQIREAVRSTENEALLRHVQEELATYDLPSKSFARVLRVEHLFGKNSPSLPARRMIDVMGLSGVDSLMFSYMTLENRTTEEYNDHTRILIKAAEQNWTLACRAGKEVSSQDDLPSPRWKLILKPNAGGRILTAYLDGHRLHMISKSCGLSAQHRMTVVVLALRRFEFARGCLPASLQELVPVYLSAVPIDPFDGQPLRWDAQKKWLYSVSENQTDDRGAHVDPEKVNGLNPDFVMPYWWLPESAKK
jgi:hypothetical protein